MGYWQGYVNKLALSLNLNPSGHVCSVPTPSLLFYYAIYMRNYVNKISQLIIHNISLTMHSKYLSQLRPTGNLPFFSGHVYAERKAMMMELANLFIYCLYKCQMCLT